MNGKALGKDSESLLSASYMAFSVLSVLYMLMNLILTATLWDKYQYGLHLT